MLVAMVTVSLPVFILTSLAIEAVTLNPGDILVGDDGDIFVADELAFGGGGVIRVNPMTGEQFPVASGLSGPLGVALEPDGNLLVIDTAAVTRVNLGTGGKVRLSPGGGNGIAVSGAGE